MQIKNVTDYSTSPRTYRVLGKVIAPGVTVSLPEWARSNRKVARLVSQGSLRPVNAVEIETPPVEVVVTVPDLPTGEAVEVPEEEILEDEESEDLDLSALRKIDLQELMEERGLPYKSSDSKASLIEALSDG